MCEDHIKKPSSSSADTRASGRAAAAAAAAAPRSHKQSFGFQPQVGQRAVLFADRLGYRSKPPSPRSSTRARSALSALPSLPLFRPLSCVAAPPGSSPEPTSPLSASGGVNCSPRWRPSTRAAPSSAAVIGFIDYVV
eukprot:gene7078-biopygen3021